jgi:hypothetical protein
MHHLRHAKWQVRDICRLNSFLQKSVFFSLKNWLSFFSRGFSLENPEIYFKKTLFRASIPMVSMRDQCTLLLREVRRSGIVQCDLECDGWSCEIGNNLIKILLWSTKPTPLNGNAICHFVHGIWMSGLFSFIVAVPFNSRVSRVCA